MDLYMNPETHDLDLQGGVARFTQNDIELTRQRLDITLNMYRGEWFANILEGVPYIANKNNKVHLLGKTDKATFDLYMREAIIGTEGVAAIEFYNSVVDNTARTITINTRIVDISGEFIDIENFPVVT